MYNIEGSSHNGTINSNFIVGNFWNHSVIKNTIHIKPSSCRIIKYKIKYLGKKKIFIDNKEYLSMKFMFSSTDSSLSKDKNFQMTLWYDSKDLILLKTLYNNLGKWEYILKFYD